MAGETVLTNIRGESFSYCECTSAANASSGSASLASEFRSDTALLRSDACMSSLCVNFELFFSRRSPLLLSILATQTAPNVSAAVAAAAAGRRIQPRHFHAGPHPSTRDKDQMPAAAVAAAPAPLPSLHRHALESICAFLPLPMLAKAMRVSREWRAAVLSMAACALRVSADGSAQEQRLAAASATLATAPPRVSAVCRQVRDPVQHSSSGAAH